MAFNVSTFRNSMKSDGARPNLFEVFINPFPFGGGRVSQDLTFKCKTAQLPGSTIGSVIVPYFGREVKFAGNRTFPDWTVTVINDEDFAIKNAMEQWMNAINQHALNSRDPFFVAPSTYVCQASVTQYGKAGEPIKDYTFVDMFPIDISPIDVDWGANDTIEEFTITFQYQYWLSNTTDARTLTGSTRR